MRKGNGGRREQAGCCRGNDRKARHARFAGGVCFWGRNAPVGSDGVVIPEHRTAYLGYAGGEFQQRNEKEDHQQPAAPTGGCG